MLKKIINALRNPARIWFFCSRRGLLWWVSDKKFLEKVYKLRFGRKLDLNEPKTYNEKLQWLKLYDRKPIYTIMVDKYEAKKYVADKIGEEYIIPTLGVWDSPKDIEFDALPNQFVLKWNHDSGSIVICKDKSRLNYKEVLRKLRLGKKHSGFWYGREWPYKNVEKKIIAEKYMEDQNEAEGLTDYKFYCFNGEPKFLYVSEGLQDHSTARISFLTTDWQFAPYVRTDFRPFDNLPRKPECLSQMLEISKKLSENVPFLRVDLYEINGKIYFSELTFYPCSGFMPFENPEHDLEIGKMLNLPKR